MASIRLVPAYPGFVDLDSDRDRDDEKWALNQSELPPIFFDASTPPVLNGTGTASPLTSAAFSPPGGSLLLALCAAGWNNGGAAVTMSASDTGGHAWHNPVTANGSTTNGGAAAIFYAWVPTAATNITVSIAYSGFASGSGGRYCDLLVLGGASPDQSGGATGSLVTTGTNNNGVFTISPNFPGSEVWGVSDNSTNNLNWFPDIHTRSDNISGNSTDSVSYAGWRATTRTPRVPSSVPVGGVWSASCSSQQCAFEVTPLHTQGVGQLVILQAITTSNYW